MTINSQIEILNAKNGSTDMHVICPVCNYENGYVYCIGHHVIRGPDCVIDKSYMDKYTQTIYIYTRG